MTNNNQDWLTALLLKSALAVIGACGVGYAGYTYKAINDYEAFKLQTQITLVQINSKLELVINDINYHHREGEVKVQH